MASKKEVYKENMYRKLMPTQALESQEGGNFYYDDDIPVSNVSIPTITPTPTNTDEVRLVNFNELLIMEKLDVAITKFSCCNCDRCRKEITAIALNLLPSNYLVLGKDEPMPQVSKQVHGNVSAAIIKAIVTVKANPKH